MPRAAAPALALLALLAAAAPAARAASCVTELKWAAEAQAYAKPVRVHFKGYPSFGLRSENKGTVSGSVLVTMPAVNNACNFGSTLDPKDAALSSAIAAATISTPAPLKVSNITGKFGRPGGLIYATYTVSDLEVDVSSAAVGGRVNQRKKLDSMTFKILKGTANVAYESRWYSDSDAIPLAGIGVVASGCSLTAKKATGEWTLDCNRLKAVLDTITQATWEADISITVRGTGLSATAPMSTAKLIA